MGSVIGGAFTYAIYKINLERGLTAHDENRMKYSNSYIMFLPGMVIGGYYGVVLTIVNHLVLNHIR